MKLLYSAILFALIGSSQPTLGASKTYDVKISCPKLEPKNFTAVPSTDFPPSQCTPKKIYWTVDRMQTKKNKLDARLKIHSCAFPVTFKKNFFDLKGKEFGYFENSDHVRLFDWSGNKMPEIKSVSSPESRIFYHPILKPACFYKITVSHDKRSYEGSFFLSFHDIEGYTLKSCKPSSTKGQVKCVLNDVQKK